jgi:hypothetical protein
MLAAKTIVRLVDKSGSANILQSASKLGGLAAQDHKPKLADAAFPSNRASRMPPHDDPERSVDHGKRIPKERPVLILHSPVPSNAELRG